LIKEQNNVNRKKYSLSGLLLSGKNTIVVAGKTITGGLKTLSISCDDEKHLTFAVPVLPAPPAVLGTCPSRSVSPPPLA